MTNNKFLVLPLGTWESLTENQKEQYKDFDIYEGDTLIRKTTP